jgi:hypothetical protein
VGEAALAGRPGVLRVEKGFRWPQEIDRVTYDPGVVTVPQMEDWLKQAGTYIRTATPSGERVSPQGRQQ